MSASTQSAPAPKAKIAVVIDDDRFIRYLLDLHLRKAGYEVFTAEDAVAAGRVILERGPDVILCDVDMPFMDGYEFVSALRADPATRHIPVIFLTVNKNVGERAKQLGAGYLVKPVMADELLRTVAQFVPPGQPSASS
ncbi:MAG TPA: response regulator [Burkholderiales bacterium]|nr:response regulator [Burkholderiales bacterium]